jgi:hypothetical protein
MAQGIRPLPVVAAPAALANEGPQTSAPSPQITLRVVEKGQFCTRLEQAFAKFAVSSGLDRVHTALLASGATAEVVQELRAGRASDYMRATALRAIAHLPESAPNDEGYLPLTGILGEAMGLSGTISLALSAGELRFIPSAQKGIDIVVIAQNGAVLSPQRVQKVIEIANNSQIHISVVWVGEQEGAQAINEAKALAWIAANTGGAFTNLGLSDRDNSCGGKSL